LEMSGQALAFRGEIDHGGSARFGGQRLERDRGKLCHRAWDRLIRLEFDSIRARESLQESPAIA
jgi:hypothetical protein